MCGCEAHHLTGVRCSCDCPQHEGIRQHYTDLDEYDRTHPKEATTVPVETTAQKMVRENGLCGELLPNDHVCVRKDEHSHDKTTTGNEADPEGINHPKHYNVHPSGVECIKVVRHMGFNLGNVVKYLWRDGIKDTDVPLQDLKKAAWYLNDEISRRENRV